MLQLVIHKLRKVIAVRLHVAEDGIAVFHCRCA
jgi:hypothetical protein